MHTWQWRTWQELPYLTCSLLDPWRHGFFTQRFWPRSPLELTAILQPAAVTYRVKQVHGNQVLTPSEVEAYFASQAGETEEATDLPPADGLLTEAADQAVWSCSADCTPALIGDVRTGQVAAIHAGWRGTAAKVLPLAVARFQEQGSCLADLRIALGPAIAGQVYQVSAAVAAEVGATVLPHLAAETLIQSLQQLPEPPILPDEKPGHVRLDVRQINKLQLERLGIGPEQIAIAPHCTYQEPENFFSYRRDGRKQVQWSGIVSRAYNL